MPTTQVTPADDLLLQGIAESLFKARKVVVITGAGISTNSGIPDFRSENGLYSLIQTQFDAANREDALESRCPASLHTNRDEREPPTKRRRLSFEDSGIFLSDDSQATEDHEVYSSEEDKSLLPNGSNLRASYPTTTRANGPITRARSRESTVEGDTINDGAGAKKVFNRRKEVVARSTRSTKRATSLPPDESPRKGSHTALRSSLTDAQNNPFEDERSARRIPRRRGRSASPDARPRANAYQARSAVLRKRSLLTSPLDAVQTTESNETCTLVPLEPRRTRSKAILQLGEVEQTLDPAPKPVAQAAIHVTPKTTRFFFSSSPLSSPPSVFPQTPTFHRGTDCLAQSNLRQPVLAFSSSPLSSPPPVLFDPFEERSSSTSRQTSSVASSTASSETGETPPSSQFSKSTLPNIKGRDLFDASIWADPLRTSVFYTFATTLRQKVKDVEPTESHHFIGHLRNRGKLVRCYTQNIDQIEEKVGLSTSLQEGPGHRGRFSRKSVGAVLATTASANTSVGSEKASTAPELEEKRESDEPEGGCSAEGTESADFTSSAESQSQRSDRKSNGVECVFLHGSLESLRCFLCGKICAWDEGGRAYETLSGRQPECPYCAGATAARQERGKRALGVGKLRPDIVLYGEEHPNAHLISPIVTHDLGLSPDLLLILGTSLKVHGLKVLVREFAKTIHSRGGKVVFVNYTKPPESSWGDIIDYWVQWDCDAWVSNLKERIPLLWLPPGTKLPRKKKENSDKPKKRQGIAEEGLKPKPESSKPSENAPKTSQPEAAVKSEKPSSTATPEAAIRTPLPRTTTNSDRADEPVKNEYVRKKPAKQRGQVPKVAVPKAAPRRPMAVRDDTTNAVYVMLKVMTELRRITGSNSMPPPPSPASPRVEKPKSRRTRKSAPAALPHSSGPNTNDATNFELKPSMSPVKQEVQQPESVRAMREVAGDVTMSGTEENSILAAVKLNPRTRKRKTIDGEEVFVPGMSRLALAAKALPRPIPQKRKTPSAKNRAVVVSPVSPKILLDIRQAPMDSLTLPPLRRNERPAATPVKLQPLEPVHSPAGPLSVMSPNSRTRPDPKMANPFFYSDSLVHQLKQAPDWTRAQNNRCESPASKKQSKKEADAAMALQGLEKG